MIVRPEPSGDVFLHLLHYFFDSWLIMLIAGWVGHSYHIPALAHLGYWLSVAIVFGLQCLLPVQTKRWEIKK